VLQEGTEVDNLATKLDIAELCEAELRLEARIDGIKSDIAAIRADIGR
jgi:hypothetical protein